MKFEMDLSYDETESLSTLLIQKLANRPKHDTNYRKHENALEGIKIHIHGDKIEVWDEADGKAHILERKECPDCKGLGVDEEGVYRCCHCGGHGRVMKSDGTRICPLCRGHGKDGYCDYCKVCDGRGLVLPVCSECGKTPEWGKELNAWVCVCGKTSPLKEGIVRKDS